MLSHLFAVVMAIIMMGLGFWQLDRLDQRRALNAEIEAAARAVPVPVEELLSDQAAGLMVRDHRATIVTGTYRDDLSFLVANRTFDTRPGSWLATPVALPDGRLVVVARGWVSRPWVAENTRQSAATPQGTVEVSGRVFASVDGGRSGTSSTSFPEVSRLDLATVTELLGVDVVPLWVQLERQQPPTDAGPVPVPPPVLDDGPHLSYAFQWFFFASGTVVVYGLILRRRRRELRREALVVSPPNGSEVLLLAVRLRSRGTREAVLETAGWLGADVEERRLDDLVADGLLVTRGDPVRFSLSARGDQWLTDWLNNDLSVKDHARLDAVYQAFAVPNRAFLAHCARWGSPEPRPSAERLVELDLLIEQLVPLLTELAAVRRRFASYPTRLAEARSRVPDDPDWFESPRVDSVHTIWFELHEHLLVTLGRERTNDR